MKYPIELELTDHCGLQCECCPNKNFIDKGFISDENFYTAVDYVYDNRDNVLFFDLCGVGDIFLHPNIDIYLYHIAKVFSTTDVAVLIPTKGVAITAKHLKTLKELKDTGLKFNISVGLYSMREGIHDAITGVKSFSRMMNFIKQLQKNQIPYSLEMVVNKFSINELDYFYKFGDVLGVNYEVHNYHNFGGSIEKDHIFKNNNLEEYKLDCSFVSNKEYAHDFYCDYTFPFIAQNGFLYSCSHGGKQEKFKLEEIINIFKKFPKYTDLLAYTVSKLNPSICKGCTYFHL